MKMNPEVKARWVAALRSGEYVQSTGTLRTKNNEFCCLGVLCDLRATEKGITKWSANDFNRDGDDYPNDEVCDWAGFPRLDEDRLAREYNPEVRIGDERKGVADHNDEGATFAEIADAIEAQL